MESNLNGDSVTSVLDFSRSFVRFRLDLTQIKPKTVSQPPPFTLNNSRFTLECRCQMISGPADNQKSHEYVLSSSCKAEQVNVSENIWHDPAADMCLVASQKEFLVIKSWDRNNKGVMLSPPTLGPQPERQAGLCSECFSELRIDLKPAATRLLSTTEEIVDAVLSNVPLVSQTEFLLADQRRVTIEYPIKCINASERENFYQVDTGPVLIPDPTAFDGRHKVSELRMAFIAHNSLGATEFLVNVPTPIESGLSVNHYSHVVKVNAVNRMFAID
ncbi:MAG: hypothetical protein FJ267_08075 [Planctomycetes bacterium]|nr:hypothetical protein [Planctomycetota bacterium]